MKTKQDASQNSGYGAWQPTDSHSQPLKPSTTVWTNHGEPQPLDDKHFGVALETEVETEATRQAEFHPRLDVALDKMRANIVPELSVCIIAEAYDKLQLELIQARLERGQFRKERDEWKREFLIASDWRHRFQAQRDELLAAANQAVELLRDYDNDAEAFELLKSAIANASK